MSDDSELRPFVDALRADVDAELKAAPDLVAVVVEANRRDPSVVSSALVEEIEGLAEVVQLHRRRPAALELELDPFVEAMRGEIDASLSERGLAKIPPQSPSKGRHHRAAALGWGLGVAAALALVFVAVRPMLVGGSPGGNAAVEAQRVYEGGASGRAIAPTGPQLRTSPSPSAELIVEVGERGFSDKSNPTAADEVDAQGAGAGVGADGGASQVDSSAGEGEDDASATSTRPEHTTKAARPVAGEDELAALDRRAQSAWHRGDLAEAERLLRELTERGGTTGRAELAFGDLFTLAHQRGRPAAQSRYWRSYLRVFPRGRFVDDARAGLCRQRDGAKAAACWRRYLVRQPRGSHRHEAEEALARAVEEGR